ncbi:MAG: 50S ribosomal protein L30 [Clostridioides difficile]
MSKLKIKLVRSVIGTTPNQKKNVEALGLRKREQVVVKEDNAQTRGMINKVSHLLEVTEIAE